MPCVEDAFPRIPGAVAAAEESESQCLCRAVCAVNGHHLRYTKAPPFSDASAWVDCSVSTIERPHEVIGPFVAPYAVQSY